MPFVHTLAPLWVAATFAVLLYTGCKVRETTYERPAYIAAIPDCPPPPNFFEPVDYIAWLRAHHDNGKPEEWAETYSTFWKRHLNDNGMPDPTEAVRQSLFELADGPIWKRGDHPEVDTYLESIREYLALFRREVEKPGYLLRPRMEPPESTNPMLMLLPSTPSSRYAVISLLAEARCEGPDSPARLTDAWRVGLRHAMHLHDTNHLMMQSVAATIRAMVMNSMLNVEWNQEMDAELRREALQLLAVHALQGDAFVRAIRCEWAGALGTLQSMFPKGRPHRETVEMIMFDRKSVRAEDVRASPYTPVDLAAASDEYFAQLVKLADYPITAEAVRRVAWIEATYADAPLAAHPLQPIAQTPLVSAYRMQFQTENAARATRLVLLVHQYHDDHGKWPKSLSQVSTENDLLTDLGSGAAFAYRIERDAEGESYGFTLYSVGEDGVDNGGNHKPWVRRQSILEPATSDVVYWPLHERAMSLQTGRTPLLSPERDRWVPKRRPRKERPPG